MKFTLLAPLLLSSTAFAGAGRWKRQEPSPTTAAPSATTSPSFTICRDARDCASGERCMFVTHNGLNNGYNGACVPEDYSYVPPPQPTPFGPCKTYIDCRDDEFCQYGTITADGKGEDGQCVSSTPGGNCSSTTMCLSTQYCNNGKCTDFQDCRSEFCSPPVGEIGNCVAEQANITDTRNPDNAFVCEYTSSLPSSSVSSVSSASSASSVAASSSDSASSAISSAASSAASAGPTTAPESSSAATPPPAPSSEVAPAPAPSPAPEPAPQAEPSSAPAPAPSSASSDDGCPGDDGLYQLLEDILAEIKCIQQEVKDLNTQ